MGRAQAVVRGCLCAAAGARRTCRAFTRFAAGVVLLVSGIGLPAMRAAGSPAPAARVLTNQRLGVKPLHLESQAQTVERSERIIVRPQAGADRGKLLRLYAELGCRVRHTFPLLRGIVVLDVGPGTDVARAIAALQQSGWVQYAERDHAGRALLAPNDPYYAAGEQWGLNNTGVNGGVAGADIMAEEAWSVLNDASNVLVAVVDSGVRYTHQDLAANMWTNPGESGLDSLGRDKRTNGVDDDGNGYIDDVHGINVLNGSGNPDDDWGHGSHTAGIVGAVGNNGVGIAGVAWRVKIMSCKFIDRDGNYRVSDAITALDYARAKGARIVTAAWGGNNFTSAALRDAVIALRDANIIVVAAAGNDGGNNDAVPLYPASYEYSNVISVAATNRTDARAWFTNYGAQSVDLGAPGEAVLSCWSGSNSDYRSVSGTSMASAHVAGACALLWARFPGDSHQQIISRLLTTVDPLPALAGRTVSGGRLNLAAALASGAGSSDTTPPAVASFTIASSTSTSVTYQIVFSETVTGVDGPDFTAVRAGATGGTATVGAVTAVSGTTYRIPVSFTGSGGTLQLNLNSSGTGIQDAAGNAIGTGAAGPTHTVAIIDTTPPAVASFTIASSTSTSVTYQIAFSETVTGVDGPDFTAVRAGATGGTATVGAVTAVSGTTYRIPVSFTGSGGTVQLNLNASGTGIQDAAGNAIATAATGPLHSVAVPVAVPVVTSATVSGQVGTPITHHVQATNSPTSFGVAAGALPGGLALETATGVISGTPNAVASAAVTITATNSGGSGSGTLAFNITAAPSGGGAPIGGGGGGVIGGGGAPGGGGGVIGGGSISIPQTIVFSPSGDAIVDTPFPLAATTNSGLPITFTLVRGDALVSGQSLTPRAAGTIVVRASSSGGGTWLPGSVEATIRARNRQTLTFNSPVSGVSINTPFTLSATTSAGDLPIAFSVVSGDATLDGNVLTPKGPGAIVVRASQAGNDTYAAASTEANFGQPSKAAQAINCPAIPDTTVVGGPITISATASSGLPVNLSVSGPARLSGNTIVLTGTSGTVTVRAEQNGNDRYHPAAEVVRTFSVRAIGQQVCLGTIGSDPFAVVVSQDGSKGMFVTTLAGRGEAIVARFTLEADGSFRVDATRFLSSSRIGVSSDEGPSTAAFTAPLTLSGAVNNGAVSGSLRDSSAGFDTRFTGSVSPAAGPTAALAGMYIASIPGSASGDAYIVATPNGTAFAVAVMPFGFASGTGTIGADGVIDISTAGGGAIAGKVDPQTGTLQGALRTGATTAALVGISEGTGRSDRIVNLSSRLRVVGGDADRSAIAGFVISGPAAKPILVRAVGPGLSAFGVQDALANPRLQLYRGSSLVAGNEDWSNRADVSATSDKVGAFELAADSRDSALVATLEPGAYTAIVTGVSGSGVVLVEIYDAATGAAPASQRLVNLSTRGFVDAGEGNLIAGIVVTGNAPKRVLIRGIGPGLTPFNVSGVVADPALRLHAGDTATVIAQNDDWSSPQPVVATQLAASAAELSAASAAAGAFALPSGSKDAALLITLVPGNYTAVVSGANNSTGVGLVEVYEVANP